MNSQATGFVVVSLWGYHVAVNPMLVVLIIGICLFGYMIWQGQRSRGENTFDVWDLLMDTLPDPANPKQIIRRASGIKCAFQISFFVSTWVIVDREIKGTLEGELFGIYTACWCASLIAKVVFNKSDMPKIQIGERGCQD